MLPEETQVEDVLHHQCIDANASTLSEIFFAIGCPFFWFEHLPPKMSVHVPAWGVCVTDVKRAWKKLTPDGGFSPALIYTAEDNRTHLLPSGPSLHLHFLYKQNNKILSNTKPLWGKDGTREQEVQQMESNFRRKQNFKNNAK